ncbi:hypothetical protein LRR81_20425 [Metabacillus sp. GX 13764]|uniref:hypothetical protein n=1 Tax=Metabacillus kandeliae TaxID=2900151 RepID=UPI001E33687D|nr:hypothetical protein [Metabacillus kandeliae]MCD7036620.1 hypothetical protein [Metabacillus kandeliae]
MRRAMILPEKAVREIALLAEEALKETRQLMQAEKGNHLCIRALYEKEKVLEMIIKTAGK